MSTPRPTSPSASRWSRGVAQVQVYGSQKYAVRIQLDPKALATRGIGIDEVSTAIQNANVDLPTGTLYGAHQAFTVETKGQLTNAAAYRSLIVAYQNGSPVRLDDVGRVLDSVQNDKTAGWANGEPSVVLAIQRQPGTNTVEVVDNVMRLIPAFQAEVPAGAAYQHARQLRARLFAPRSTTCNSRCCSPSSWS